jgi:hypothetical protein
VTKLRIHHRELTVDVVVMKDTVHIKPIALEVIEHVPHWDYGSWAQTSGAKVQDLEEKEFFDIKELWTRRERILEAVQWLRSKKSKEINDYMDKLIPILFDRVPIEKSLDQLVDIQLANPQAILMAVHRVLK